MKCKVSMKIEKIVYIIVMIMFFIFPTSMHRVPHSVGWTIMLWGMQSIIICYLLWIQRIEKKQLLLAIITILYLMLVTMIALNNNDKLYISLARIAPIVCFILMCCVLYKSRQNVSFYIFLLDIMCVVLIVWNLLTLMRIEGFIEFVNDFYTQLDTYTATYWSLVKNKPIFTFGVHNFASVFYMHIFLFNYFAYKKLKRKRFVLYMLALLVFTLLLRASSSAGIACVMILFLANLFVNSKKRFLLFIILVCICAGIIWNSGLLSAYIGAFSSKSNGFFARYSSETNLYAGNYQILKELLLGIGFTIGSSDLNIYFGDSGYIIYYTMGGLLLPIMLFILIYRYYRMNLNRKMALILTGIIALTELSLISFMYEKTIYLYIFEVGFYRSILGCKERQTKGQINVRVVKE